MVVNRLLAQFPGIAKANLAVWGWIYKQFRIDNPHVRLVNYVANKSMTKLQQKRVLIFMKQQFPKLMLYPATLAFFLYHVAYLFVNAVPRVHNYRLTTSHESREARHLEYLKDNPKYLPALLHGYQSLAK